MGATGARGEEVARRAEPARPSRSSRVCWDRWSLCLRLSRAHVVVHGDDAPPTLRTPPPPACIISQHAARLTHAHVVVHGEDAHQGREELGRRRARSHEGRARHVLAQLRSGDEREGG